jgi:nitrate/nitrite-specific signal transduction histidine kinase
LRVLDGRITLEVKDNGRGITKAEISNTKSMGLLGMRERASLMGGTFRVRRVPRSGGTKVSVTVPLEATQQLPETHEDIAGRRSRGSAPRAKADSR